MTSILSYGIIPLLTLISSVVNLTINVMGRLYQAKNYVRRRSRSTRPPRGRSAPRTAVPAGTDGAPLRRAAGGR